MRGLFLLLALIVVALPYGATAVAAAHQQATGAHAERCVGYASVQSAMPHQVEFGNRAERPMDAHFAPAASCLDTGSCTSVCVATIPLAAVGVRGGNAPHWRAGDRGLPAETHSPLLRPPIS
jgi:hypothetical protein